MHLVTSQSSTLFRTLVVHYHSLAVYRQCIIPVARLSGLKFPNVTLQDALRFRYQPSLWDGLQGIRVLVKGKVEGDGEPRESKSGPQSAYHNCSACRFIL